MTRLARLINRLKGLPHYLLDETVQVVRSDGFVIGGTVMAITAAGVTVAREVTDETDGTTSQLNYYLPWPSVQQIAWAYPLAD